MKTVPLISIIILKKENISVLDWMEGESMSKTKEQINLENGKILRGFRKQNKLTQAQVGSLINRGQRAVSFYETGSHSIPIDVVNILNGKYNLKLIFGRQAASKSNTPNKSAAKTSSTSRSKVKSFAEKMADVRKSMNMTLDQFASKYSMSYTTLWRIEHGESDAISLNTLRSLHKSGVDILDLIN